MFIYDAQPITFFILMATFAFVPFFTYWLYKDINEKLAFGLTAFTILWGSLSFCILLFGFIEKLSPFGGLLFVGNLLLISTLTLIFRKKLVPEKLDQKKLVGLQIFRLIGGVFLIEMIFGNIPSSFAIPAGWGDIAVGLYALWALVAFYNKESFSAKVLVILAVIGLVDFVSAFFFGFTSGAGPFQLFAFGEVNFLEYIPTGLIPLFFVPYATAMHILSLVSLKRFGG